MAWYRQGSVSIEAGSNVVIGTGTKWTVNLYGIGEGQALVVNGERLEIMYVDSDTKIRLALPHEAGYTGNYHIETSYAGTGGDASRQIMAAIRRLTTLSFDWTEWMTSDAATITATDVLGQPVEIATYKSLTALAGDIDSFKALLALDGFTVKDKDGNDVKIDSLQLIQSRLKNITDAIHEIETPAQTVIFKHDVLAKEIGIGYPRNGASPATRFGYHAAESATPRLYMTDGVNAATLQFVLQDGIIATRQWMNQYVTSSMGGGSQLRTEGTGVSVAVNPNNNAGIWDQGTERWMLRMNPGVGAADVTKNLFLVDQDAGSTSSKVEIASPDRKQRVGLWAYNDGKTLLSGYRDGRGWGNIDVYNLATAIDFQANDAGVSLQSQGARAWYTNKDGNAGIWNKNRSSSDLMVNSDGFNIYMPVVSNPPSKYGSFTVNGYSEKFMWEANGGPAGGCYFVRRNSANTNLGYLALPIIHGSGTVVTSADAGLQSVYVDGSGYVKKASPIVMIKHNGYSTNAESRGAKVTKLSTGEYLVTNILGYNGDGAWGINGGISVPKDVNGLELVYVKDEIQSDGSIVVNTYHRQHSHLPEMFQNNRKKKDGSFYADGEPCDLPTYSRLDLRVQMPENCEYNRKTYAIERHNQLFIICKSQQDVLLNKTLALPLL